MINATLLDFAFSLSGLNDMPTKHRVILFSLTLLCYFVIFLVNGGLILMIVLEEKLHEPMYIFLCNLCVNSLYGTVAFYPKFLYDLWSKSHVISYTGCLLQVFLIYTYAITDFSILALMAYDRYVAICRPLEYHSVMTKNRVVLLVCFSRLVPVFWESVHITMTSKLQLCGSHIDKLYCENWAILKLSCSSITAHNIVGYIITFFYFGHDVFIVFSYVHMIKSAVKSREDRRKFMQTCVPHLLCLLNVSVAMLFDVMYARYGSVSVPQGVRNFMAIQFLLLPPLLNPIIYGLKLTQIRTRLFSLCSNNKQGLG
ncbi:olfactory receptor 11H6-like [Solea senegalensis]|uniref:Olfactory receptor 11H6-like n=1 Tax=Solea senegalensis TaxID=28829 RepID=A0AAV6RGC3_SOLSE|nr:putative gustatory receptor clone PTE03 [Solea senegalensis]KAG7503844.1 olfactory receptor 11H6-like [Solea senegalensis]